MTYCNTGGCGTTTSNDGCDLIRVWDGGCDSCGNPISYHKGMCVAVCRKTADGGTIADLYESLVNNNGTFPQDGISFVPPTWVARSLCQALVPNPDVVGDFISKTVDPVTGKITYKVTACDTEERDACKPATILFCDTKGVGKTSLCDLISLIDVSTDLIGG